MSSSYKDDVPCSPELRAWLEKRDRCHQMARRIAEAGGHVMLRSDDIDPGELPEPLKSEAIDYLRRIGEWSGEQGA